MSVDKFSAIFDGLQLAYGTYKIEKTQANGKNTGRAAIVRETRTTALWEGHLSGKGRSVGIIPINEDNKCVWGCIDVDQYPLDHKLLVEKLGSSSFPLLSAGQSPAAHTAFCSLQSG